MDYAASIKASSVTSTISADPLPALFSGASECDEDSPVLQQRFPLKSFHKGTGLDPDLAIQIPYDEPCASEPLAGAITIHHDNTTALGAFLGALVTHAEPSSQCDHVDQLGKGQHVTLDRKKRPLAACTEDATATDKRARTQRELLTDDEKRANHIASEQKRRSTIRTGFKEMTDLIPTLKNVNNSKSTILFKAVEYIKYLEKRIRSLDEKSTSLRKRIEVKRRVSGITHDKASAAKLLTWPRQSTSNASAKETSQPANNGAADHGQLRPEAVAALMTHKNQQQQLALLQEHLRMQQALLANHNVGTHPSMSIPTSTPLSSPRTDVEELTDATSLSLYSRLKKASHENAMTPSWSHLLQTQIKQHLPSYDSISIPASELPEPAVPLHSLASAPSTPPYPSSNPLHTSCVHSNGIPSIAPSPSTHSHPTTYAPALLVPVNDDDHHWKPCAAAVTTPCLNIPADDDYGQEPARRERLLSCGKLKST